MPLGYIESDHWFIYTIEFEYTVLKLMINAFENILILVNLNWTSGQFAYILYLNLVLYMILLVCVQKL